MLDFETAASVPLAIGGVGLLLLAAAAIGSIAIRASRLQSAHNVDRLLLSVTCGVVLLGWMTVVADRYSLLSIRGMTWILAAIGGVGTAFTAARVRTTNLGEIRAIVRSMMAWQTLPFWLLALLTLGPALCIPAGWDELVYHHVLPQRWLRDEQLLVYDDLPYSGFPSLAEVLCLLIAPLDVLIAPRLFNWCCCVLAVMTIARVLSLRAAERREPSHVNGSDAGHGAIVWSIACCPALLMVGQNCYIESLIVLTLSAMLLAIVASRDGFPVVVVSLLAAGAAAVKLTGIIVPVIAMALIAMHRSTHIRRQAGRVAAAVIIIALVIAPFYNRPWVAIGNPFHPYFAGWFVSDRDAMATSDFHHSIGTASFGMRTLSGFACGPVLLAFMEELYDGSFGWQLVVLTGLALVGLVMKRTELRDSKTPGADASSSEVACGSGLRTWQLVAMTAMLFVFWFFTSQQARFLVPILVPVALLAMVGLSGLSGSAGALPSRVTVFLLVATSITSLPWRAAGYYAGAWESLAGVWTREEILDDATGGYYVPLLHAINEKTTSNARLLLLFEHRGLYIPRWHAIGTPFFQPYSRLPKYLETGGTLARVWRATLDPRGITHLVIANSPIGPDQAPDYAEEWSQLYDCVAAAVDLKVLRPIWTSEEHMLFEVVR